MSTVRPVRHGQLPENIELPVPCIHTIDMKEGQESQELVSLSFRSVVPLQMWFFAIFQHQHIRHDVSMRKHNALGVAGSP